MELKIGISPCPNDTYIFEGLYKKEIIVEGLRFHFVFADIKELNRMAEEGDLDIIKVSYAHVFSIMKDYVLLPSGGALGYGVGPVLISKKMLSLTDINPNLVVGIPGIHTTANFLLQYAFPQLKKRKEMLFSNIEEAVAKEEIDLGLIIHENRFTYQSKGLHKVLDLGSYWEEKTKLPIPLGGIIIKRVLGVEVHRKVNDAIRTSIIWQKAQNQLSEFVQEHAQEMEPSIMQKHIRLYVNEESESISKKGLDAVFRMKEIIAPHSTNQLFITC